MEARHRGRRPKSLGNTRQQILASARAVFAANGLDRATLRSIAAEARVDPALILHYFGSKEALFFESIRETAVAQVGSILGASRDHAQLGPSIVAAFVGFWDEPQHREVLVALLRSGLVNERIGDLLRRFFREDLPARVARALPKTDLELRVALVASQLVGLAIGRYVLRLPALAEASKEELASRVGPTISRYLAGAISSSHRRALRRPHGVRLGPQRVGD